MLFFLALEIFGFPLQHCLRENLCRTINLSGVYLVATSLGQTTNVATLPILGLGCDSFCRLVQRFTSQ